MLEHQYLRSPLGEVISIFRMGKMILHIISVYKDSRIYPFFAYMHKNNRLLVSIFQYNA